MDRVEAQIQFVVEADRLKSVLRQTSLAGGSRRENSAEHSWHLALMVLALGEHAPPGTDLGRVLAMVVLHDLVEIDAGDLFLYADAAAHDRQMVAERAAAERIFAMLPPPQGAELRTMWEEFEDRVTPEARFARALDRLQPMLLNIANGGDTWVTHRVPAEEVLARVALIADGSPALGEYARTVVESAIAEGVFGPPLP